MSGWRTLGIWFFKHAVLKNQPHPRPACHARLCLEIIHMKTKRKFTVVIEQDEDGYYVATVPALRGCHTQAKTLDTLMKRVREVVQLCLPRFSL
jgi:hypothetical protein